jgi:hypothetical protein
MINQTMFNGKNCLRLTITQKLNKQEAAQMCQEWKAFADSNKPAKHVVIINALDMTDYEPMSRVIFQETINELKTQIESIWVITNSKLISAGAALMGLFTSFKIKSVASESQIAL